LWFEDVTEIVTFLQAKCRSVEISTENYKFKSIEELKEHAGLQTLPVLQIHCHEPYVTIDLTRMEARLYVSHGDHAASISHEIDPILAQCQRWLPWAYSSWFATVYLIVVFGSDYLFLWGRTDTPSVIVFQVLGLGFLWIMWAAFVSVRRSSVIRMQRRADRRPFVERNQDQLIMLLIGAIVGGMVTFAGVALKEHFYPSSSAAACSPPKP
jgi:hypothetical protein